MTNYESANTEELSDVELVDSIDDKLSTINGHASSYDQGWVEALKWARSLIVPESAPKDEDDEPDDDEEPFAKPAAKATKK